MKPAYRPLLVVLGMFLIMTAISVWRGNREPPKDLIPWRSSLAAAREESAKTGKPVLAYFTATWCPPCQQMKHEVWPVPQVRKAIEPYVPVKVDVDEYPDVAKQYVFEGIPMITVLRADGSPERVYDGPVLADALIQWLHGP